MTSLTKNCFLFPSRSMLNINGGGENGDTHYTIFALRHRYAKIVSEPKGGTPSGLPPIGRVGFLV